MDRAVASFRSPSESADGWLTILLRLGRFGIIWLIFILPPFLGSLYGTRHLIKTGLIPPGWGEWFFMATLWAYALIFGGIGTLLRLPGEIRDQRRREGRCLHCGYDLRATPGRCPECGTVAAGDAAPRGIS